MDVQGERCRVENCWPTAPKSNVDGSRLAPIRMPERMKGVSGCWCAATVLPRLLMLLGIHLRFVMFGAQRSTVACQS
eukprot:5286195-Pyramimonas_sp.AAC.1